MPAVGSSLEDERKRRKAEEDGRKYEIATANVVVCKEFERLKDDGRDCNPFAVGREVRLGEEDKFDDLVLVEYENNIKYLTFAQIKHKQGTRRINSDILTNSNPSIEEDYMKKDFNLQKYFVSYSEVKKNLKITKSEKLKGGTIKYMAIFTNAGLDTEDLKKKGFILKQAPDDIKARFSVRKSQNDFYQFDRISNELREQFEKSSDLDRLPNELAKYIVHPDYKDQIMTMKAPIQQYNVALANEVISIKGSDNNMKKSPKKCKAKDKQPCCGYFKHEFINNEEEGAAQELRGAIFEAIKKIVPGKKNASMKELKTILRDARLKLDPSFGKNKKNTQVALPERWEPVKACDITDFLESLVLIVNQPYVEDLEESVNNLTQDIVLGRTFLKPLINKIKTIGPDYRKRVLSMLIHVNKNEETWTSDAELEQALEDELKNTNASILTSVKSLIYEHEIMQYGSFSVLGKLAEILENFLLSDKSNILCIGTPETALSSVKIHQFCNKKHGYKVEDGRISINLKDSIREIYENNVIEAFKLDGSKLLIIECSQIAQDVGVEKLYKDLSCIMRNNLNKKIIMIIQEGTHDTLNKKFATDFENAGNYISEMDHIVIEDFNPKDDPLRKELIPFQGQVMSFSALSGIRDWNKFLELSKDDNKLIDTQTFFKLLNNEEIKVGSKPLRTCSLEGAYVNLCEEIKKETFYDKLSSRDNMFDEMYIISGIKGSNENKLQKLFEKLGMTHRRSEIEDQVEYFVSDRKIEMLNENNKISHKKIQVTDDKFKEKDFLWLCQIYPERNVFWIVTNEDEVEFKLHQFYDPNFYLKRKFKNFDTICIKKDVKELLIAHDLIEIFIFSGVNDREEFMQYLSIDRFDEQYYFRNNCRNEKIRLFDSEVNAENAFNQLREESHTQIIHRLQFKNEQIIWYESRGSLKNVRKYIHEEEETKKLIDESDVIQKIKDKKTVIIADNPGMGKSTTLTKLYELKNNFESIMESHWVIRINLINVYPVIKDIDLYADNIDMNDIIEFLSKVDENLNNNLSKNLLKVTLNKSKLSLKPILILLDGFDELLYEKDRNNVILMLKFLKNKTEAKVWVTTRLQYKQTLEDELWVFALEFDPMDTGAKIEFIKKYLKIRLSLTISKKKFENIFSNSNQAELKIQKYAKDFLEDMQSVFQNNVSEFLGTPLQLNLMLEISFKRIKESIENGEFSYVNFDFLCKNIWEIYEKFVNTKYKIYFTKANVTEEFIKEVLKDKFDQNNKDLAKSLIHKSDLREPLAGFKNIVLLPGIIKHSNESGVPEFIHSSFRDYFAAQSFIGRIVKMPNDFPNSNKQEYFIKEILMKPSYELIRIFLNAKLKEKIVAGTTNCQINIPESNLKQHGEIISKLWGEESITNTDEGTVLHTAVKESNMYIIAFIFSSIEKVCDFQEKFFHFLRIQDQFGQTVLHWTLRKNNYEIIEQVLTGIKVKLSEDQLFILFSIQDNYCRTVFDYFYGDFLTETSFRLEPVLENYLKLTKFLQTDLHRAVKENNYDNVMSILNGNVEREFLFAQDYYKKTALHYAVQENKYKICKAIRDKAAQILTRTELCHFFSLQDRYRRTVLHFAIDNCNYKISKLILNAGKHMFRERFDEFLSVQDHDWKTALHFAAEVGPIYKLILKKAQVLDPENLVKFLNIEDFYGYTFFRCFKERNWFTLDDSSEEESTDYSSEEAESDSDEERRNQEEQNHIARMQYLQQEINKNLQQEVKLNFDGEISGYFVPLGCPGEQEEMFLEDYSDSSGGSSTEV